MNETGKVFVGTHNRPKGRRWVYGQFSDVALPAAQLLLEQSGLNPTERGNPVQVVRAIASIVNTIFAFDFCCVFYLSYSTVTCKIIEFD